MPLRALVTIGRYEHGRGFSASVLSGRARIRDRLAEAVLSGMTNTGTPAWRSACKASNNSEEIIQLRDGRSVVSISEPAAGDEPDLQEFLAGLCLEARRLRFFTGAVDLSAAAHWAATESDDRYGLLARDEAGMLVGHAVFIQLDERRAEVAIEVADRLHGRGLGTILLERLGAIAEQRGITGFVAEVLPDNKQMLDVFRDGFDARVTWRGGIEAVEFPTSAWQLARDRYAEHGAIVNSSPTPSKELRPGNDSQESPTVA